MLGRYSLAVVTAAIAFSLFDLPTRAASPTTARVETDIELASTVSMVPTSYRHRLVQQLSLAEDNQQTWLWAIVNAPAEHREALAYLLTNMPETDLKKMKGEQLLRDVELAYLARAQTTWGKSIPQELFFRDVLPYANVDETREDWRSNFYARFMPLVKETKSASDAVRILNKNIFSMLKVKYHATKREKPNQSPLESVKIGYASCTGLSIILSDACRSVGIPARVVGTPRWSDDSGNHTWTEIWDKQWYFVGAAEPGALNKTWFVDNAARADDSKPEYRIYAASFEQTPTVFPLVWDETQTDVRAIDVTAYYTYRQSVNAVVVDPATRIELRQNGMLVAAFTGSTHFELPPGNYTQNFTDAAGKVLETKTINIVKDSPAMAPSTQPVPN